MKLFVSSRFHGARSAEHSLGDRADPPGQTHRAYIGDSARRELMLSNSFAQPRGAG
jgi:hypothetical protein